MFGNSAYCPEIEELKKAILLDPPEEALNSNSNSKDKFNLIQKKEKELAFDFLKRFNELQETITNEKKNLIKEKELMKAREIEQLKKEEKIIEERKKQEKSLENNNTKQNLQNLTQRFSRLANIKELEEFNQENNLLNISEKQKIPAIPNKKRKLPHQIDQKTLKQIKKNSGGSPNKLKIEFKEPKQQPKKISDPLNECVMLKLYKNEEKKYNEADYLTFIGTITNAYKNDDLWFLEIEKIEKKEKNKLNFKGIFNTKRTISNHLLQNEANINIEINKEYVFEFKSAPKKINETFLLFIENLHEYDG